MRPSIRSRLVLGVIGGMAVMQIGLASLVFEVMERASRADFDAVSAATARTVSGAVEHDASEVRADIDERDFPEFRRANQPDYYEVWLDDGRVLARSSSLKGGDLDRVDGATGTLSFRRVRLPDGRPGRAAVLHFLARADDEGQRSGRHAATVVVARDRASLDGQMATLTWLLTLGTGGTIAISFFLAVLIVRRGLSPLERLATRIATIDYGDLSARVAAERLPVELRSVAERLNELLRRLESAFDRERAFTSDAAHELRTPLAGLRSTLEVALARPRQAEEYQEALSDCLTIVEHTERVIGHLLTLARMDGRQTAIRPETLAIADLVEAAWRSQEARAGRRGLSVRIQIAPALRCSTDRALLLMVFSELAANAAAHTEEGGQVEISGVQGEKGVDVEFVNSGCPLGPEDAPHVFERFWRGDGARGETGLHSGLGLALVQSAVAALGGTVSAATTGGRFSIRVSLPADGPVSPMQG